MKKYKILALTFFSFIILSTLAIAQATNIFALRLLIFQNDTVVFKSFQIAQGVPDKILPQEVNPSYLLKIISSNKQVLFQENMKINFLAYPEEEFSENVSGLVVILEKVDMYLKLPFFNESDRIQVYHDSKLIFDFKIPWCNDNGICEVSKNENYLNCPQDCHCGNKICDKNLGETSENCSQDCPYEKSKTQIYTYLIILSVIITIIVFFIYKIRVVG